MAKNRKKLTARVDAGLLERLRAVAKSEGRHLQAILEDAIREYLDRHDKKAPRPRTLAHARASLERNRRLGELLSK